jgi:ribosomal protein S18 acetylase RimI-like enzyme
MLNEAVTQEQIVLPPDLAGSVFTAPPTDSPAAVGVITMGFSTDPVARWVYPEAADYLRWFPPFIRAFAGKAFETNSAYCAKGFAGAALWLPPEVEPDEQALMDLVRISVAPSRMDELFRVLELQGAAHPKGAHWYLPMIAVDTFMQGKGIGSDLMRYGLARCDEEGLPAYLESTNPRNISLYTRFGFEIQSQIQVGGSPPMFTMLRSPRGWYTPAS